MKRTVSVLGFLAFFTLSNGFMFKMMHWPGASIISLIGFLLLSFGFLPAYFYGRYKAA
jgi:hypothetical protein